MNPCILLVDDETDNLRILADFLYKANPACKILKAKNGVMALKILEKETPDLILTDWNMPGLNGLELLIKVKELEKTRFVPVIMQTANTEDFHLRQAFEEGATDYIKKPINEVELLARVRSALAFNKARLESERLLLNIFPQDIIDDLKPDGASEPRYYELVSPLFTDFKGFTQVSARMTPKEVLAELNDCFSRFDEITEKYGMEKIKTIGDAYMCVGGLPKPNRSNPVDAVLTGLEMQRFMKQRFEERQGHYWQCRLGINSGEAIAGVIGKKKFAYDIWGDTVNVASRMESHGEVNEVNISAKTYELVKDFFLCEARPLIEVKGKGVMKAYFVRQIHTELSLNQEGVEPNQIFWDKYWEQFE
ncbi:MAG: adenylate/guanylate cyclase domain-containing protein [Microscillaceae bacterium]|nr:adenylate/guanylate cyclase domain-containing protein [Microscillaceae bacterium]